jgi:predicted ATPase/DNA-binding SARP family transcriptional activator
MKKRGSPRSAVLHVYLFGPPRLFRDGAEVRVARRKSMALLAYLALAAAPVDRDALAELLFPGQDRERAYGGLRLSLTCLRKAVGGERIAASRDHLALCAEAGLRVDILEFRSLLERARLAAGRRAWVNRRRLLGQAIRIYRGGFLSGFPLAGCPGFEQWRDQLDAELVGECAAAFDLLIEGHERAGDPAAAVHAARAALALDPLEEAHHRRLMRLLALTGRRAEALRQFERCRQALARELAVEPAEATRALRDRILADDPSGEGRRVPASAPARVTLLAALPGAETALARMLARHGGGAVTEHDGSVRASFPDLASAAAAALAAQAARAAGRRPRIAVHVVDGTEGTGLGDDGARIASLLRASRAGQVLVCVPPEQTRRAPLPHGAALRPLGPRGLSDLGPPANLCLLSHRSIPARLRSPRTIESLPGNIRCQSTFLVGRGTELEELIALLRREETRLVTLIGPGGTGKTRLALQVAALAQLELEQGAWMVDLSAIRDPRGVAPSILSAMGIHEPPGSRRDHRDALLDALRRTQALLVLDNFEHLIPAAPLVGDLAAACPGVKLMATSREPLRLGCELQYAVPPLPVADACGDEDALLGSAAVRLFIERARRALPGFSPRGEQARTVARICAGIDGLPLAIELAAARVRALPPTMMLRGISQRMRLLANGPADLPERQRTMRGEIGWSYELLTPRERRLFRRLSVFPGIFSLEGAEAVGGGGASDLLSALIDKSTIERLGEEPARFRMLQTIREYAGEMLRASAEAEAASGRLCAFAITVAERAAPLLLSSEHERGFAVLDAEQDCLIAALERLQEAGGFDEGVALAGALGWFWFRRGRYAEAERWLSTMLEGASAAAPSALARAWYHLGWTRLVTGSTFSGNGPARDAFRRGMALWRAAGDRGGEALCAAWLGWGSAGESEADRDGLLAGAERAARACGDPWVLSFCLRLAHSLAPREDERPEEKTARMRESIELAKGTGDPFLVCQALHGMGDVYTHLRDEASAEPWYQRCAQIARRIGDVWTLLDTQGHLAWGYANRGDLPRARAVFANALRAASAAGARAYVGQFLAGMSSLAAMAGKHARALRLGGAAAGLRADASPDWDPRTAEGTGLAPNAAEREWVLGGLLSMDEAVRLALEGDA